jgi:1,6-anhydro-N-acetylmuramate kinase
MTYRAIGLMSGSSLDGLDIVFAELNVNAGNWNYEILAADCYEYSGGMERKITVSHFIELFGLSIVAYGVRALFRRAGKYLY